MKTILVPVDFSPCSAVAVRYAFKFAEKTDRRLLFFHSVFEMIPTSSSMNEFQEKVHDLVKESKVRLREWIDELYSEAGLTRDEHRTRFRVKYGPSVVHNILEATEEHFIDLIILGTHGASGFKKTFLGSNTSKLIEQSYCPVLAIPEKPHPFNLARMAFGVTDLHDLKKDLKNVIPVARKLNLAVDVFHVRNDTDYDGNASPDLLEDVRQHYGYDRITLETIEKSGEPLADTIQSFIHHKKPDLLAMLTHKRGFIERIIHPSQTSEIAFHPQVPLLAVK